MISLLRRIREKWHNDISSSVTMDELLNYERSIFSYVQNQYALRIRGSDELEYVYHRDLHKALNVRRIGSCWKYERLGQSGDGGYIVVTDPSDNLSSSKIAYSFGISNDVSFDLDIANRGYEVFQYDHTIQGLPIDNLHFHWRKLGIGASTNLAARLETLENVVKSNGHENVTGMLLKMDIERAEWDVIKSLPEDYLKKFDQILIEMHGLLDYELRDKCLQGIEIIGRTHQAVHVHANNFAYVNYCGDLVTPGFVEVTYLNKEKYKFSDGRIDYMRLDIDQPNSPHREEIDLGIWNVD